MELGLAYADVLPTTHRQALAEAADFLLDTTLHELQASDDPEWGADNWLIGTMLPPRYAPRYTSQFARKFFVCLTTIVWKLGQLDVIRPSCVAEELAAHILIQEAETLLHERGEAADFGSFEDDFFEDVDFEFLFSGAFDGVEESELGQELGIVNLAFGDWFKRFGSPGSADYTEVHPYVRDDDEEEKPS